MNLRFVFKLVGRVELMVAASLLLPLAVALFYGESPWPFVLTMGLILCVCAPLARMPAQPVFFQREGFVIVGLIMGGHLPVRQPALLVLRVLRLLCGLPL